MNCYSFNIFKQDQNMNSNSSSKSNLEAEAEELQFLTVDSSDDHEMNTNNMLNPNSNPNNNGSNNGNSIGSYLFTQSKVSFKIILNFIQIVCNCQ